MGRTPQGHSGFKGPSASLASARPLHLGKLLGLDSGKGGPGLYRRNHGVLGAQRFHGGSGASSVRPASDPHSAGLRDLGEGLAAWVPVEPLGNLMIKALTEITIAECWGEALGSLFILKSNSLGDS